MRFVTAIVALSVVVAWTSPAAADPKWIDSFFDVTVDVNGDVTGGGGGGGGAVTTDWYYYENTDWWNVWFYDHPYDPTRYKIVNVSMDVIPTDIANNYVEITLNWSTPDWVDEPLPPLPPLTPTEEGLYIERYTPSLCEQQLACAINVSCSGFVIPVPYNPEWISIDIRGYNFEIQNGSISHACVPEPATMGLFALGALALLRRKR